MSIYMDYASATPVDPRVLEFALPYLDDRIGNPSSLHSFGLMSKTAVVEARSKVAQLINAPDEDDLIFTGSATESNNLGLRGLALRNTKLGKRVVVSAIEHMSILNPAKDLQKNGFDLDIAPVDSTGLVDLEALSGLVTDDTSVVSVMHGNSEIGTIQPIDEIAALVHERDGLLHVDATASAGKVPVDVSKMDVDLLTLSGNDLGGPQGAGALYVKKGVKVQTVMPGGGQERGLRSGTENVFAVAGMGEAARLAREEMPRESERLMAIRDTLVEGLTGIPATHLTGHPRKRLPHHVSVRFGGIEGEAILLSMDMHGVSVSTGSACSSRTLQASHVLLAMGLKHEEAHGSMVLTLGRSNDLDQARTVVDAAANTVEKLRALSPL